ncbi:hypothetical protein ACP70R_005771 [Stipagrostis hirtigluma subsp. patula]
MVVAVHRQCRFCPSFAAAYGSDRTSQAATLQLEVASSADILPSIPNIPIQSFVHALRRKFGRPTAERDPMLSCRLGLPQLQLLQFLQYWTFSIPHDLAKEKRRHDVASDQATLEDDIHSDDDHANKPRHSIKPNRKLNLDLSPEDDASLPVQ